MPFTQVVVLSTCFKIYLKYKSTSTSLFSGHQYKIKLHVFRTSCGPARPPEQQHRACRRRCWGRGAGGTPPTSWQVTGVMTKRRRRRREGRGGEFWEESLTSCSRNSPSEFTEVFLLKICLYVQFWSTYTLILNCSTDVLTFRLNNK